MRNPSSRAVHRRAVGQGRVPTTGGLRTRSAPRRRRPSPACSLAGFASKRERDHRHHNFRSQHGQQQHTRRGFGPGSSGRKKNVDALGPSDSSDSGSDVQGERSMPTASDNPGEWGQSSPRAATTVRPREPASALRQAVNRRDSGRDAGEDEHAAGFEVTLLLRPRRAGRAGRAGAARADRRRHAAPCSRRKATPSSRCC